MKSSMLVAVLSAIGLALLAVPANAQATRTWVSGVGDDANPCSRTAPCKTFAGAIVKTSTPGEIDCLDPGGFGALTITKAITIDCLFVSNGGVLVAGTNGITIAVPAGSMVTLKGLDFEGLSPGSASPSGVSVVTSGSVFIEDCTIRDFSTAGINFAPSASGAQLTVNNVFLTNNGTAAGNAAILLRPTGGANATVIINNARIGLATNGIFADGSGGVGTMNVNVANTAISNISNNGITVSQSTGTAINAAVVNTLITYSSNAGAVLSGSASSLTLGSDTITNNVNFGMVQVSGTFNSFKNNQVVNNGNANAPSGTITQISFQ